MLDERAGVRIRPDLDEFRELLQAYERVPVRMVLPASIFPDPASIYAELEDRRPHGCTFLLESAVRNADHACWTYVGSGEPVLRWRIGDPGDPFALAETALQLKPVAPVVGLPPFIGGLVGVFGYDIVREVEDLGQPPPDAIGTPDLELVETDTVVAYSIERREIQVVTTVDRTDLQTDTAYQVAVERLATMFSAVSAAARRKPAASRHEPSLPDAVKWRPEVTPDRHEQRIRQAVAYIHAGDAYQVVLSERWTADVDVDALAVYLALRDINPSPYMFNLNFRDWQIVGASPEPLITVRGRDISMRPLAGTRPRSPGDDDSDDVILSDEKERSEHVMLLDLCRNDLGRICEFGSIGVPELMTVERYSHVLHIASTVRGTLVASVSPVDALRAVLPAGTVSGAPKIRAMQLIDEIEQLKRGAYAGAVVALSRSGHLDSAITIRSAVITPHRVVTQAGGGIVVDALPGYEHAEAVSKAASVQLAVQRAFGMT